MGLAVNGINNANIYNKDKAEVNYTSGMPVSNAAKSEKIDASNDHKFSLSQAMKNFAEGLVSPVTGMFSSLKNFAVGAGMIAGSIALVAVTGGAAAPLLVAAGVGMGAVQAAKAGYKIVTAKNGDEVEKAFYDVGGAASTIGLSVVGAKGSLKQAGIATDEIGILGATKKCFTSSKNMAKESYDVFKSGYYKTNIANFIRTQTEPTILRKYSKDICKEGATVFQDSFDMFVNILPEKFRPFVKGRNKGEMSIYEKLVNERTTRLDNKIENIKNDASLSAKEKQDLIDKLGKQRARISNDYEFAKSKVEDLLGARIILDDVSPANIQELVRALESSVKKGDLKILEIENYRGVNPKYQGETDYYFTSEQVKRLKDVSGLEKVRNAEKPSGYTAVQLKVQPKGGKVLELQIRGSKVDEVGDWEHIPYDLRQNKDIAKGNNNLGNILSPIQKAIKLMSKEKMEAYNEYIYENYVHAQRLERGLATEAPELPEGIDSCLSADNLKAVFKESKKYDARGVKNPFILYPQLAMFAGVEGVMEKD